MNTIRSFNNTLLSYSLFLIALFLSVNSALYSQVSAGGIPYSFSHSNLSQKIQTFSLPPVNTDSLIKADKKYDDKPLQYGYPIRVDVGLKNSGNWDTVVGGGRLWRLRIISLGAYSLNLTYDKFWLPKGATFFLYSNDKKKILGAFNENNNKSHGKFATDIIKGEVIILEYYEPPNTVKSGEININRVIHGYKEIGCGSSQSCNNNVNCTVGKPWFNEINSVAMILNAGGGLCSGCLVNNEEEDLKQYFLTANHCFDGDEDSWIFRFNYQSPGCTTKCDSSPTNFTVSGATLKARNDASDFFLLELQETIPDSYKVHYAGWYKEDIAAIKSVGIHHPKGDVKKISFDNDIATSNADIIYWYGGTQSAPNTHWQVIFDNGIVEQGSSGSPLFNENHLVSGQLHGGNLTCYGGGYNYYGKLSVSWDYNSNYSKQLKHWLDPGSSGLSSVKQIAAYDMTIKNKLFIGQF